MRLEAGTIGSMADFQVVVEVEVSNATKYYLSSEGYFVAWGHVKSPPVGVNPGKKGEFIAHKSGGATTGTTGVAVWKIGDTSTRLVVLWSAPWNHNHHSNMLAVGLKEGSVTPNNSLYKEMYYESETWFSRRGYNNSEHCVPVTKTHSSEGFKVKGSMGTSHKTDAKVELLPLREDVVADSVRSVVFEKN